MIRKVIEITTLLYIFVALLVFGLLIFIHEFGHFLFARLFGVGVKEFSVGMGPQVFSWRSKKYSTKYGLKLFPIGGFVSMVGEDEESNEENAFCNKSIIKRMCIVLAGPVMNILLGFLLMLILVIGQKTLLSTTIYQFKENSLSAEKLCVEGTNVLLLEMPFTHWTESHFESVEELLERKDIRPIIAHADRYQPDDVERLLDYEIPLQLNVDSLRGLFMPKHLKSWIEHGHVCALGSDIHGSDVGYAPWLKAEKKLKGNFDAIMERTEELIFG